MITSHPQNLQPAFRGASFDSTGLCLKHPDIKLSQKVVLNGRVVYKELKRVCPRCQACKDDVLKSPLSKNSIDNMNCSNSFNKSAHSTVSNGTGGGASTKSRKSDGSGSNREGEGRADLKPVPGGSVRKHHGTTQERRVSGSTVESRPRSLSRSRPSPQQEQRGRSREEDPKSSGRSSSKSNQRRRAPSLGRTKPRKEYDTPFDSKGRCHYHAHVQLARKKLTGGWKVIMDNCTKCMEESYINENSDNRSVVSGRSVKSSRSVRSSRSTKSASRGKLFSKNNNQYESPFDSQGFCHQHSYVRLAKKKTLGGWKIIQSFCPECAKEDIANDCGSDYDGRSVGSRGSRNSRRSMNSRASRMSKSSRRSGRSRYSEGETESAHSTSQSEQVRKRIVKKMAFIDSDNGERGFYTGYVNGEYQPHGRGKMSYENGEKYEGTWCEGSKVHGKMSKSRSSDGRSGMNEISETRRRRDNSARIGNERKLSSRIRATESHDSTDHKVVLEREVPKQEHHPQKQLDTYRDLYTDTFPVVLDTKTVKNMKFVDFYGDPGRYTGEVNSSNMPHGMGEMTYDHGLVQGGKWTNGILDEGSIVSCPKNSSRSRWTSASGSSVGNSGQTAGRTRDP